MGAQTKDSFGPNERQVQSLTRGIVAALKRPSMLDPRSVDRVRAGTDFLFAAQDQSAPEGYRREGPVAVMDIEGPLAQRAWDCAGWFGGDGYDAIVTRFRAALADTETRAVLMRIDSPGGEVAGCFEAVRMMRAEARSSGKRVVAYVDELTASAAYALASVADRIVVPASGTVGSVGVIATVMDESRALEDAGVVVHLITSGERKADGHPAVPLSVEAHAAIQGEVDYLASVFFAEVSEGRRGLTLEALKDLKAGVFLGPNAVKVGLADSVGGYLDALALAARLGHQEPQAGPPTTTNGPPNEGNGMNTKEMATALGMAEDASDQAVLARAQSLAELESTVQTVTGKKTALRGAVMALGDRAAAGDKTATRLRESRIAYALRTRRLTDAELASRKAEIDAMDDDDLVAWLEGRQPPRGVFTAPKGQPAPAGPEGESSGAAVLNAEELRIGNLMGIDPKRMAETKRAMLTESRAALAAPAEVD